MGTHQAVAYVIPQPVIYPVIGSAHIIRTGAIVENG
jgi:hypothetical protein